MLKIQSLNASVGDKSIIKSLNLSIQPGEVHAIMGPNGSGKSTLSNVITGHPDYQVTAGHIHYQGEDILEMTPDVRATKGLFMSFQYPVGLPGVTTISFLQAVMNAQRKQRQEPLVEATDLIASARVACEQVGLPAQFLHRALNKGFSGGEKKRAELLQMRLLEPKLAILDETVSGLDIDALKMVGTVVNEMRDNARSFVIVTHYPRILEYIKPDYVHVMRDGNIIKTGDAALANQLEKSGYAWLDDTTKD
jgi:Fe-S cluster assembly ATP-binding protein